MKRFIFLSVTAYFVLMGLMSNCQRVTHVSTLVKLQRAMRLTNMAEYHDDDYGYTVRYPVFFQRSDDTMMDKGSCRFSFWRDDIEVVQCAFVEHNPDALSVDQAIQKYTAQLHASSHIKGDDYFILAGALADDSGKLSGRRFFAKFVQHRKFWFVQTLTYPEQCEKALQRLIQEIYNWQVWKNVVTYGDR